MSEIHTGGGASIGGNANAGGDIVGRDQIFVTASINMLTPPKLVRRAVPRLKS